MAGLAVGMNTFTYDAIEFQSEIPKILNFAQNIEQVDRTISEWLEQQVANTSNKVSNNDIAKIANIIIHTYTDQTKKIELLTQIYYKDHLSGGQALGLLFFCGICLCALADHDNRNSHQEPTKTQINYFPSDKHLNHPQYAYNFDLGSFLNWLP